MGMARAPAGESDLWVKYTRPRTQRRIKRAGSRFERMFLQFLFICARAGHVRTIAKDGEKIQSRPPLKIVLIPCSSATSLLRDARRI